MVKISHPSRTQPDRHDLIAARALNDPGGSRASIAVTGGCGSWLVIHGSLPLDRPSAQAERQPKGAALQYQSSVFRLPDQTRGVSARQ
jgi:hypothetical protein